MPTIRGILSLALILAGAFVVGRNAAQPAVASPIKPTPAGRPDAVWITDDWTVEVNPTRGIVVDIARKAVVNGPRGRAVGRLRIWETFYQSLKSFSARVTDTLGGVLYSVGKYDLEYGFPFSDYRLYSNDRLYTADLAASTFPYVVEYRYRLEIDNTFFWPDWIFCDAFPRRRASYTVQVPHLFRYRTQAAREGLQTSAERTLKRDVTRWTIENVVIDAPSPAGAPYPVLFIAPESFVVARQRGSTESWKSLGRWYAQLTAGRRMLSRQQEDEVKSWLSGESDPQRIVSRLKEIISQNWRYVAIEVGIGGWRPHEAASVFASRYGDCKDLTFLWLSMLDVYGIPAYPAMVRARNPQPLDPDFPKDWFDHLIGCAIIGSDTIWADLTAPGYPAGKLPYQVEDRWALIITPDGGELQRTPSSGAQRNRLVRSLVGRLTPEGQFAFTLRAGVAGHKLSIFGPRASADNRTRQIAEVLGVLPGRLQVDTATFAFSADSMTAWIEASGAISEWAEATATRLVFPLEFAGWAAPQPLNNWSVEESPALRPYPCQEIDSLVIILPPGYVAEFVPRSAEARGKDGSITVTTQVKGDTLMFFRRFEALADRASRAAGPDIGQMAEVLAALQRANAVFVRQEAQSPGAQTQPEFPDSNLK